MLARRMECAVCCVTYILQFLRPRFLKPLTLIANRPLKNVGQVPLGSIIIRHNGVQGLAGHFNGTKAITSNGINAPTFDLGRAVIPARKQRDPHSRHSLKPKWFTAFPWLRHEKSPTNAALDTSGCYYCKSYPHLRNGGQIASGEQLVSSARQDYLALHDKSAVR